MVSIHIMWILYTGILRLNSLTNRGKSHEIILKYFIKIVEIIYFIVKINSKCTSEVDLFYDTKKVYYVQRKGKSNFLKKYLSMP